jgi:hypothetical protein
VVPAAAAAAAAKKAEEDAVRKQQMDALQAVEGNAVCADCSHPGPDWVSINLGILICLECSGVHRAIGVHVTKVRSLTLDKLDAHLVQFLRDVGNTKSNQLVWEQRLYEQHAHAPEAVEAARQAIIKRDGKDSWIRAKYERKEHMSVAAAPPPPAALSAALYDAITACDLLLAIKLLRMGASVNWPNEGDENRTPLHQAVNIGSGSGCELLLQHGASTDLTDVRLWTALHYAAYHEDADCAEMLLLRGANPCLKDYNEQDCADLAPLDTPLHERLLLARGAAEEKQRKAEAIKLSSQSQAIDSRTLFLRSASIDSSSAAAAGGHALSPSAAASMSAMSKSYSNARSEKEQSKEEDDGCVQMHFLLLLAV